MCMKSVGEKIKQLRKSKGLSLKELAQKLDVSDTSLSKIETGKVDSIKIDTGKKLSNELGVSFNELFEIESPSVEIKSLQFENEHLKNEVDKLEEQLADKKRTVLFFQDTLDFFSMYAKNSFNEILENEEISALDLHKKVGDKIRNEKGAFVLTFTDEGKVRIKFLSEEEKKMYDAKILGL